VLPQIGVAHHMASCVRGGMNWGLQAFLATYKTSSCGLPHSSSASPIGNQAKRPSLKGGFVSQPPHFSPTATSVNPTFNSFLFSDS